MTNSTSKSKLSYPTEPYPKKDNNQFDFKDKTTWGGFFSHDPAIYYDECTKYYYTYSTDAGPDSDKPSGGQIRRSKDLIHFEYIGVALENGIPDEVKAHTNAVGVWAPDIIKVNNEYRLYYSCSTFGSRVSAISLATSASPEGPFKHQGIVLKTTTDSPVNAIDANLVVDEITKEQYFLYGSFWDGIRMLKLDANTGFLAEEGYGIRIASRNTLVDRAIEGPYIRYNDKIGYYYLFVSYESLSNHYNVRVGRSKNITGPYVDFHDRLMTDLDSNPYEVGLKITTGYSFKKDTGWIALGHNSVLNHNGDWYMVCHARFEHNHHLHALNIRRMFWTLDGWPIVSPSLYTRETLQNLEPSDLIGTYAKIEFENNVNHLFQTPTNLILNKDFTFISKNKKGVWNITNHTLTLQYTDNKDNDTDTNINLIETFVAIPSWDYEEWSGTITLTGMDNNGRCSWGKKIC